MNLLQFVSSEWVISVGVEAIVARSLYIVSISEPAAGATLTAVKHFIPHLFSAEYI